MLLLAACAAQPPLAYLDDRALRIDAGGARDASDRTLFQASARSEPAPGWISTLSHYEFAYGNARPLEGSAPTAPDWQGTLGTQRLRQDLSVRVPTLLDAGTLHIDWSGQQERRIAPEGVIASASQSAHLRWAAGPLQLQAAPLNRTPSADTRCAYDAALQPFDLDVVPLQASAGARRCERLRDGSEQSADLWTTRAAWSAGERAPGSLQVSRLQLSEDGSHTGTYEIGTRQALQWQGWSLEGEFAWQPREQSHGDDLWGSRAKLTRTLWRTPLSASWRRNQPQLWSLPSTAAAGHEVALALDLSRPLREALLPRMGGSLSYQQLRPDDPLEPVDNQVRLDLRYDWR